MFVEDRGVVECGTGKMEEGVLSLQSRVSCACEVAS